MRRFSRNSLLVSNNSRLTVSPMTQAAEPACNSISSNRRPLNNGWDYLDGYRVGWVRHRHLCLYATNFLFVYVSCRCVVPIPVGDTVNQGGRASMRLLLRHDDGHSSSNTLAPIGNHAEPLAHFQYAAQVEQRE